jgi:uncharacterized protein (TIGR04141 family)
LRAVTGKPLDQTLGTRMSGTDAITVAAPVTLKTLPSLVDRYSLQQASTKYKKTFPWVDHIREIHDPTTKGKLEAELINRIQAGKLEKIWMAPPDLVDWSDVQGFRYRGADNAATYQELDVNDYIAEKVTAPKPLSVDVLKRHHIACVSSSTDQPLFYWTAYRCLNAESQLGSASYILSNGSWYRIDTGFMNEINTSIATIPVCSLVLPPYKDKTEAAYSGRVAKQDPSFVLLDRETVQFGGGRSKIEICDLYHATKRFIHLKPYSGSAALSHLFNQGLVSATLFLTEAGFRALMNGKLPSSHKIVDTTTRPNPAEFEIVYGIIGAPTHLPFFSKVSLRNAHRLLAGYGYKVSTAAVSSS